MNMLKPAVRFALASAVLALTACATQDARYADRQEAHVRAGQIDYQRMAEVNRAARSSGVEVVWVNPPYRSGDN